MHTVSVANTLYAFNDIQDDNLTVFDDVFQRFIGNVITLKCLEFDLQNNTCELIGRSEGIITTFDNKFEL